ncbi:hypothetical protein [Chitinivibrio alkaliphilus]|uniref:Uncharacterized protein n=1 Tax=Chitinivibrio alkaliphilus ACht1 TaxID=1313304 RepID=U7D852_9BACT|nr:hypothetical protein [Chitinivibrio alkaliphilus]ERP31751.1 hypothetical protein CALK_1416 [Chitinivibrio alkaliphilus ACht1]
MPVLKNGEWEAPFWGSPKSFITGQDMLGMQNTSIATYSALLPGLTNLTRRIRYYGFYMWLLEQYAETEGKVSVSAFRQFIRRGELIFAFMMADTHTEENGIVGISYAQNHLKQNSNPINIAAGADRKNENTYWKYSAGAFGQYYQGALSAIGLIAPSENESRIPVCTADYGRKLAKSFESTIAKDTRDRYIDAIKEGKVTREELTDFGKEFSTTAIKPHSPEWEFYIDMLFGKDLPTVKAPSGHTKFRVETILLYLGYLKKSKQFESAGSFPVSFHYRLWKEEPFIGYTAYTGWHYYALNEFAHYSLETILWACLVQLKNEGPVSLSFFIESFTDKTLTALDTISSSYGDARTLAFASFAENLYTTGFTPSQYTDNIKHTNEDKPYNGIAYALHVLAQIYWHDKTEISKLNTYVRKHGMCRDGDVTELLKWVEKNENLPIPQFFRKLLLQHVINRHIEVAMRKMRNRNENTIKFTLEDNILSITGKTMEPVWTGPRLKSLHQFLVDLKLVRNNTLLPLGENLLREHLK